MPIAGTQKQIGSGRQSLTCSPQISLHQKRRISGYKLVAARKSGVAALLKLERSKVDDRLRDDLSQKQRFIHDHEQLLSCLRTFPPELLECIFKFCLFDPEEWPPKDRRRPASFSLSHVCKRWREVALNVPYLSMVLTPTDQILHGGNNGYGAESSRSYSSAFKG